MKKTLMLAAALIALPAVAAMAAPPDHKGIGPAMFNHTGIGHLNDAVVTGALHNGHGVVAFNKDPVAGLPLIDFKLQIMEPVIQTILTIAERDHKDPFQGITDRHSGSARIKHQVSTRPWRQGIEGAYYKA